MSDVDPNKTELAVPRGPGTSIILFKGKPLSFRPGEMSSSERREIAASMADPFEIAKLVIEANQQSSSDRVGIRSWYKNMARSAMKDAEDQLENKSVVRVASWSTAAGLVTSSAGIIATSLAVATAPAWLPVVAGVAIVVGGVVGASGEFAARRIGRYVSRDNYDARMLTDLSNEIRGMDRKDDDQGVAR